MKRRLSDKTYRLLLLTIAYLLSPMTSTAQEVAEKDTVGAVSITPTTEDSHIGKTPAQNIKQPTEKRLKRDWKTWRPNPKKAVWIALVPGAGQIYNRKYRKLPIVYGGFLGCTYAITWNQAMYKDYSQAYKDIMDDDPDTQSYNQFLHLGNIITEDNIERYKSVFKKRKDYYRRYRDLSYFVLVGVYALSIIDAYVDASLSEFDISKDLSMSIKPTVISDQQGSNPLKSSALGINCKLFF